MYKVSSRAFTCWRYVGNIIFLFTLLHNCMFWISFSEQLVQTSISLGGPFEWLSSPGELPLRFLDHAHEGRGDEDGTPGRLWTRPFRPPLLLKWVPPTWVPFLSVFQGALLSLSPIKLHFLPSQCIWLEYESQTISHLIMAVIADGILNAQGIFCHVKLCPHQVYRGCGEDFFVWGEKNVW